jgi:hypothetical protein
MAAERSIPDGIEVLTGTSLKHCHDQAELYRIMKDPIITVVFGEQTRQFMRSPHDAERVRQSPYPKQSEEQFTLVSGAQSAERALSYLTITGSELIRNGWTSERCARVIRRGPGC